MQIPVNIVIDGKNVMGILHVPQIYRNVESTPVIIMCYGLNGNRVEVHRMSVLLGRQAEKNGIYLLRFDYTGLGVSDGEFWETSIQKKVKDILSGIDFIRGCFHNENISLFLLGFSDGARIALNVSNKINDVSGLCMWSPVLVPNSSYFRSRTKMKLFREPTSRSIVYKFFGLWMSTDYIREINSNNNRNEIFDFRGPSLCIFGGRDQLVKETKNKIISYNNLHNNPKIVVIPEAKHMFGRSEWTDKVIIETINWVKNISTRDSNITEI
ncbi:hypothetical protein SH1V18_35080 [Vallitalea longa]|uniref:Serine aminopeptidase S33 domain-containing protein n=1 Tax=Vallitalea longa TaxID=2936439 RepID=A0A9W5YEV3_9FIRM|nr:alpha/beta hydrolase [Vallitalea longa]GKX31028.1 hypothetical protein SH1V18_35080 [Vallitalea longa]